MTDQGHGAADLRVTCGPLTLHLHSAVLAAASDFFATMLAAPMVERESGQINVRDMDHQVFRNVVKFIYRKELTFDVSSQLEGMLEAAERFQMEELKSLVGEAAMATSCCRGFLGCGQGCRNIVRIGVLAERFHQGELLELAADKIARLRMELEEEEVVGSPKLAAAVMERYEKQIEAMKKPMLGMDSELAAKDDIIERWKEQLSLERWKEQLSLNTMRRVQEEKRDLKAQYGKMKEEMKDSEAEVAKIKELLK